MDTFWAMAIRPFALFFLLAFICLPIRLAIQRLVPDGRVKRFLLRPIKQSW
jgi:hypothetical protein